jgi:transcriptional regulator with XRE-family HTH domain
MLIGNRLKELRESKQLSQGDIEKRTGLLRCYISRVENNHTVPSVETLEKMARALEMPMYRLFHEGEAAATVRNLKLPHVVRSGGAKAKKPIIFPSCAGSLRKWNLTTKNCYCTWPRKWQETSPGRAGEVRQKELNQ